MSKVLETYKGCKIMQSGKMFVKAYYPDGKYMCRSFTIAAAHCLIDANLEHRVMTKEEYDIVYAPFE